MNTYEEIWRKASYSLTLQIIPCFSGIWEKTEVGLLYTVHNHSGDYSNQIFIHHGGEKELSNQTVSLNLNVITAIRRNVLLPNFVVISQSVFWKYPLLEDFHSAGRREGKIWFSFLSDFKGTNTSDRRAKGFLFVVCFVLFSNISLFIYVYVQKINLILYKVVKSFLLLLQYHLIWCYLIQIIYLTVLLIVSSEYFRQLEIELIKKCVIFKQINFDKLHRKKKKIYYPLNIYLRMKSSKCIQSKHVEETFRGHLLQCSNQRANLDEVVQGLAKVMFWISLRISPRLATDLLGCLFLSLITLV